MSFVLYIYIYIYNSALEVSKLWDSHTTFFSVILVQIWFSLVFWPKDRHIFRNSLLLETFYGEINHIQKLTLQTTKLAILFIINMPLTYSGLDWEVNTHASASSFAYSCMLLLPSSCDAPRTALILNTKIKKKKTPEC